METRVLTVDSELVLRHLAPSARRLDLEGMLGEAISGARRAQVTVEASLASTYLQSRRGRPVGARVELNALLHALQMRVDTAAQYLATRFNVRGFSAEVVRERRPAVMPTSPLMIVRASIIFTALTSLAFYFGSEITSSSPHAA